MADLWALALALLAVWGAFTTGALARAPSPWSWQRRYAVAIDALFIASCSFCAAALWGRWFASWMAMPLGLAYMQP